MLDRFNIPDSAKRGVRFSLYGIGLCVLSWILPEAIIWTVVLLLVGIPIKYLVLVSPYRFLIDLSDFLRGRPKIAAGLSLALVSVSMVAMLISMPLRPAYARLTDSTTFRTYHLEMSEEFGGVVEWKKEWREFKCFKQEAPVVAGLFLGLVASCALIRVGRWTSDTFNLGVVLDSIAIALLPPLILIGVGYSVVLYIFMLIFFGVSSVFMHCFPRPATPAPQPS